MTLKFYDDGTGKSYTAMAVPGQLSTSNVTSSSADLTLPTGVTGAQYYELTESTDNGATWTVVDSAIAPSSIVSPATYSRSGLTAGATYQWRLRAKFASLVSPVYSAVRSVVTGAGAPSISSVSGTVADGQMLTINGSGFSAKTNPKPLLVWDADAGQSPTADGRITTWPSGFLGTLKTNIVAPGFTQSYGRDFGGPVINGAALGQVDFTSNQLYLYRRTYEDFDVTQKYTLYMDINVLTGTISVGDTVTGNTSGANAVVWAVTTSVDNPAYKTAFMYPNVGHDAFQYQENLTITDSSGTTVATGTDQEGNSTYPTGLSKSFNFKTIRYTTGTSSRNNCYTGAQGALGSNYAILMEFTDNTLSSSQMTTPLNQAPFAWNNEEVYYKASDIDVKNGIWNYHRNNQKYYNNNFITRTTANPDLYASVFQAQVSNGAQPNSWVYYSQLYVDDTWHHAVVTTQSTWAASTDFAFVYPSAWSDGQITAKLALKGISTAGSLYLYVINKDGSVNAQGYKIQ